MIIRDATEDDLPAIVAMYADDEFGGGREEPGEPLDDRYRLAFAAISADPRSRLVVAELDGEPVGTLQLLFLPHLVTLGGERAQLEGVRIASGRRGGGLGRQLIGWAIEQARERGCTQVQLTSNAVRTDARRFYESHGFAASHGGYKLEL